MAAQLALYEPDRRTAPGGTALEGSPQGPPHTPERRRPYAGRVHSGLARVGRTADRRGGVVLCQSCHGREARYGFRAEHDDPQVDRPRTLCFECFRVEMGRRHDATRAIQVQLPLEQRLDAIHKRRRRAQIAARRALGL
jgi:hypothetical protein